MADRYTLTPAVQAKANAAIDALMALADQLTVDGTRAVGTKTATEIRDFAESLRVR